ncbi:MAG TPA: hypothetical protein VGB64_00955 [Actinomycetota bacterium]
MSVELRRYTRAEAERMPAGRGAPAPEALVFRDPAGVWWRLDAASRSWLRFDGAAFVAAQSPPDTLEGAALLAQSTQPVPPGMDDAPQQYPDANAFMEGVVERVRERYERGEITSEAAEAVLCGHLVAGPGPRIWTVGVRSGSWYEFDDGAWQRRNGPPASVADAASDDVVRAAATILESDASLLPEPVADAWEPPVDAGEPAEFDEEPPPPPPPDEPGIAPPAPAPSPSAPPPAPSAFAATHRIPASGLEAWANPDPSVAPAAWIEGGSLVRADERNDPWMRVVTQQGTRGWVDGRRLETL